MVLQKFSIKEHASGVQRNSSERGIEIERETERLNTFDIWIKCQRKKTQKGKEKREERREIEIERKKCLVCMCLTEGERKREL